MRVGAGRALRTVDAYANQAQPASEYLLMVAPPFWNYAIPTTRQRSHVVLQEDTGQGYHPNSFKRKSARKWSHRPGDFAQ